MSNAQLMRETIEYTVKFMINKLQAEGYSEAQIVNYMSSNEGLNAVKRLAEQFWNSLK